MSLPAYLLIGIVWALLVSLFNKHITKVAKDLTFGEQVFGGIFVALFWPADLVTALYILGISLWTALGKAIFGVFDR